MAPGNKSEECQPSNFSEVPEKVNFLHSHSDHSRSGANNQAYYHPFLQNKQ